jgi:hypothetical protein
MGLAMPDQALHDHLTRMEALLVTPDTLALERLEQELAGVAAWAQSEPGSARAFLKQEAVRLARMKALLESAWRLRLGLWRIAETGRCGYTPGGRRQSDPAGPRVPLAMG